MRRVPEVIDVWFDSGSMPFAQYHAPHENEEHFRERFPADFICEALDQTRGWFYSLLAVSTLLFDRSSYRNVVCLGLILDEQGRKMSKSLGNTVEPWEVIDRYGADALRWYFFTSKQPWDGYRFSLETIGEAVRQFLLQLWNTYASTSCTRTRTRSRRDAAARTRSNADLDRWVLSRLQATVETVRERLDELRRDDRRPRDRELRRRALELVRAPLAAPLLGRRPGAFGTLRECLVTVAKLLAPFCPFLADEIYDNLDGARAERPPVRLPDPGQRDARARGGDGESRARRCGSGSPRAPRPKLKVRQPLRAAVVVATGAEREAIERFAELVRDELNVRELRFVSEADELGEVEVKPNYRTLGPRFGKQMPLVAAAVAGLDPAHVAGGAARRADRRRSRSTGTTTS